MRLQSSAYQRLQALYQRLVWRMRALDRLGRRAGDRQHAIRLQVEALPARIMFSASPGETPSSAAVGTSQSSEIVHAVGDSNSSATLTSIVVTTASDIVNGDTSSITALLANPGADGKISLREAIAAANNTPGLNEIDFDIAGAGVQTLSLTSPLPAITQPLIINGASQRGYAGLPLIQLDGAGAGAGAAGLTISGGNSAVAGLIINRFSGDGIILSGGNGDTITGNYIGTDSTGTIAQPNGGDGIEITNAGDLIGGQTPETANVISGNKGAGIRIVGASAAANHIIGNRIGIGADDTSSLGNGQSGIVIAAGASSNVIGAGAIPVNLASSFNCAGIEADNTTFTTGGMDGNGYAFSGTLLGASVVWSGNLFGFGPVGADDVVTARGQSLSLPPGNDATLNFLADGVNGEQPSQSFIVTYADGTTQTCTQSISDWVRTQNNPGESIVKTTSYRDDGDDGASQPVAEKVYGYSIALNSGKIITGITLPNNVNLKLLAIDLTPAGAVGNTIANNAEAGITVTAGIDNAISQNCIDGNGALGIDLGGSGMAIANDGSENSALPNCGMNVPIIVASALAGTTLTVAGYIGSAAGQSAFAGDRVELFQASGANGQGETYLGSILADASGDFSATLTVSGLAAGDQITATATDSAGNTSEFAPASAVQAWNQAPTISAPPSQSAPEGSDIVFSPANGNEIAGADVDANGNVEQASLTVASGVLTLANPGAVAFIDGTANSTGTLSFTGTIAAIDSALSAVVYAPTVGYFGSLNLGISIDDLGNSGYGGPMTALGQIPMIFAPVPPQIALNETGIAYMQGSGAVPLDSALTLSAPTDATLAAATLQIDGFQSGEDTLLFSDQNGIVGSWNSDAGLLSLTGTATVAQYQAALQSIAYSNSGSEPFPAPRAATIAVSDGTLWSDEALLPIDVAHVNQAPTLSLPSAQIVPENGALVFSSGNGNAIAAGDVDSAQAAEQITLSAFHGKVRVANGAGVTLAARPGGNCGIILTGTIADLNAALAGLTFIPTAGFFGPTAIRVSIDDLGNTGIGGASVANGTIAIDVIEINSFSVLAASAPQLIAQNAAPLVAVSASSATPAAESESAGNLQQPSVPISLGASAPGQGAFANSASASQSSGPGGLPAASQAPLSSGSPAPLASSPDPRPRTMAAPVPELTATLPRAVAVPLAKSVARSVLEPSAVPAAVASSSSPNVQTLDRFDSPSSYRDIGALSVESITRIDPIGTLAALAANRTGGKDRAASPSFANGCLLWRDLDDVREALAQEQRQKVIAGSASLISIGVSVMYFSWAARAGSILSSLLSSMPPWKLVDPLPILDQMAQSRRGNKSKEDEDADKENETLESMVSGRKRPI